MISTVNNKTGVPCLFLQPDFTVFATRLN